MPIEQWSDNVYIVELEDDPSLSDDITMLHDQLEKHGPKHIVLNLAHLRYINSSNLAKLLKLRKQLVSTRKRLILCGTEKNVWGIFIITGLDQVFERADDLPTALAGLQIDGP